jgi:hypothetical protein
MRWIQSRRCAWEVRGGSVRDEGASELAVVHVVRYGWKARVSKLNSPAEVDEKVLKFIGNAWFL